MIILVAIVSTLLLAIYWYQIKYYQKIWCDDEGFIVPKDFIPSTKISIIVPCRNELKNIESLINSLVNISYPKELMEIMLINDHSSDGGFDNFKHDFIKLLHLDKDESGKKAALKNGVSQASGDLILCTDADCKHLQNWALSFACLFEKEEANFIAGPIKYESTFNSNLSNFQKIDNAATMIMTHAGIKSKSFYQANGANMAFRKSAFEKISSLEEKYASGDDVFLIKEMKNLNADNIHFIKSNDAVVSTKTETKYSSFVSQRKRWASKSKATGSRKLNLLFINVACILFSIIGLFLISIFNIKLLFFSLFLLMGKSIIDYNFVKKGKSFFDLSYSKLSFIINSLLYIPYFVMMSYFAILPNSKYNWKGRKLE